MDISDAPRFRWRGLLIDLGRHFFGKQTLFQIIDEMSAYKLNVLKLHLTDYEGWRLEIPAYPKLTQIGSLVDGKPQYLTTADVREIVQYAAERNIIVVPEIEMPGHAEPPLDPIRSFSIKKAVHSILQTRGLTTSSRASSPKSLSVPRAISGFRRR